MSPIFDTMLAFFAEDGWNPTQRGEDPILRMGFEGDNGKWTCYAQAKEEQQQLIFYSVCPLNVPEGRRLAMSEFLTRANYGMVIGNFEMDFEDGEIRYKTSIDVEGAAITPALIKSLSYANAISMDRYLPGIMEVITGSVSPKDAVMKIESA